MSNGAGTLITDLDSIGGGSPAGGSDNDIVAQIMADMNGGATHVPAAVQQQQAPPQMVQQMQQPMPQMQPMHHVINAGPMPNTMLQNTIDPNVATAHIIGNRQPSPADFASMMNGFSIPGGMAPVAAPGYAPQYDMVESSGKGFSISNNWLRELKTPILVAIIFCVMSLPVMNVMIGHYFPRLLRIGGDLTMAGLGVKSILAGVLFFVIQRVLVPLVTN